MAIKSCSVLTTTTVKCVAYLVETEKLTYYKYTYILVYMYVCVVISVTNCVNV